MCSSVESSQRIENIRVNCELYFFKLFFPFSAFLLNEIELLKTLSDWLEYFPLFIEKLKTKSRSTANSSICGG